MCIIVIHHSFWVFIFIYLRKFSKEKLLCDSKRVMFIPGMMCMDRPPRMVQIGIQNSWGFVVAINKLRVIPAIVLLVCSFQLIVVFVKLVSSMENVCEKVVWGQSQSMVKQIQSKHDTKNNWYLWYNLTLYVQTFALLVVTWDISKSAITSTCN